MDFSIFFCQFYALASIQLVYWHFVYFSQVPLYPASLFQNETDGEGMSFVLYFRLSDGYSKELPHSFIESIRVRASLVFNLFFFYNVCYYVLYFIYNNTGLIL
jgi:hypothetical protein